MSYYCESCGRIFEEPCEYTECVGEFWGAPAYQSYAECPYCGGSIEECEHCDQCMGDAAPDDLIYFPASSCDRICRECFEKELAPYAAEFLTMGVPDDPGWTWQAYFDDEKAYHKDMDFFDFIGSEDGASEALFQFAKEKKTREAAERGKRSGVRVHYTERR